ncbi:MAG TPA: helix-turn-helix domain-containing protein [Candidatus Limnocylindrales bacterium]|nr:helix-turn-helix domain-containing protein [Candidatus Limnocylindrales bacterium]
MGPDPGNARESERRLLTLLDVAARTERNPELLRRWCASGRIPCQRVGRDWLIDAADLPIIEAMPRRGMTPRAQIDLGDLGVLAAPLRAEVEACLEPGERVRVVVPGVEGSALVVTDRKILVSRDGVLVREPGHGRVATWPLEWVERLQLTTATASGALVLSPSDPTDRALVLLLGRPHLERAGAATTELRRLVQDADEASPGAA